MSNSIVNLPTPWDRWKSNPADACWRALMVAGLGASGLLFFMYMLDQEPHHLLWVSGTFFASVWCFFLAVSALNAYVLSHPKYSTLITSRGGQETD